VEPLLIWLVTALVALAIWLPYAARFRRARREDVARLAEATRLGIDRPLGQYPLIAADSCIGCGACVRACPEGDVLGVVHGRATVINGVRCIGHGLCAEACPVGAITVGLGDLGGRDDIPRLDADLQTTVRGVYIAGELGGYALISNAVAQGRRAALAVARSLEGRREAAPWDLVVVGAGPAGLAAALTAREQGLRCVVVDQQDAGGTILQYPRRKLAMVQPLEIPLYGTLSAGEYAKEDLLALWRELVGAHRLDVRKGERLASLDGSCDRFAVVTTGGHHAARRVILALGRRGTPRRLGVPGEDAAKVSYQLVDAAGYRDLDLLVVGGGDSAVEAAIGLGRESGNRVSISYRKPRLVRIKRRNAERLEPLLAAGTVRFIGDSLVRTIRDGVVDLTVGGEALSLPNDYVFVMAGGEPPYPLLRQAGIGFGGEPPAVAQPADHE